jgi:mannose-6-phosphate isomerase-like protein (cupin superfamily)
MDLVRIGSGYVIAEGDVSAVRDDGDTASVRLTIDAGAGSERLEQRVIRFAQGTSSERSNGARHELLYVASGRGTAVVESEEHPIEPETGIYVAPGERYAIDNPGPDELVIVSVQAAVEEEADGPRRVTVRYRDQPILPAGKDREFRYLINQDAGCPDITQFVGTIPEGRAPMHSHTYDEVVYVLEGRGVLHFEDWERPLAAGTCVHLPPFVLHCLENSGPGPMRVLGVFHPSGDPASRAAEILE